MKKYNFIKYDGCLYRLTKNAYRSWVKDSVSAQKVLKISRYGTNVGALSSISSALDFEIKDFEALLRSWA